MIFTDVLILRTLPVDVILCSAMCFVSNADRLEIDVDVVTKVFQHVCSRKATGPDGIPAFLLKTFAEELAPAWCPI